MARLTQSQWLHSHFCNRNRQPPVVEVDLTGKTVVVIGANSGIGLESVKHFARMKPARIIMGCRNMNKGAEALEKVKAETGYENAEIWSIDLNDFLSVKAFADRFEAAGSRLDILVENAGLWPDVDYKKTRDGWTSILQANTISPAFHTLLLLPYLVRTAEQYRTNARIVCTGSFTHFFTEIDQEYANSPHLLESMNGEKYHKERPITVKYYDSKLLEMLFFLSLQSHLPTNSPVTVTIIDPGYCATGFRTDLGTGMAAKINGKLEKWVALSTEEGSRQIVYGAVGEVSKGMAYIVLSKEEEVSDWILKDAGKKVQEKLWGELVTVLGNADDRVRNVVREYLS